MKILNIERPANALPIGAFAMLPLFTLPLGAWAIEHGHFSFATCGMKLALNKPCLSCGATRATIRLFHGDFLTAFLLQPMIILLYLALLTWGTVSLITLLRNRSIIIVLTPRESLAFKILLIAIPLVNWIYLDWAGI